MRQRTVSLCDTSVIRGKSGCDGGNSLHDEPKRSAPCACSLSLLVTFHPVSLMRVRRVSCHYLRCYPLCVDLISRALSHTLAVTTAKLIMNPTELLGALPNGCYLMEIFGKKSTADIWPVLDLLLWCKPQFVSSHVSSRIKIRVGRFERRAHPATGASIIGTFSHCCL